MRRPERIAVTLKEEISEIVGFELKDPRLEAITVTDVRVSDNLRDAKVFVLVEGNETAIAAALQGLKNAAPFVRSQVAMNLGLRHAPVLHFVRDVLEEKARRIDNILDELKDNGEFAVKTEE
jgi:ribosome-binding factor A